MAAPTRKVAFVPDPVIDPAVIDEYARLRSKMQAWKPNVNPHAARFAELSAQILAFYETHPAKEAIIAEGHTYKIPITPRQMKRWPINLYGFFRKVKRDVYLQLCQPTLATIEKLIPPDKRHLYIAEEQTGIRKLGEPVEKACARERIAA